VAQDFRKVDEMPFDFQRRRMSVVVARRDEHHLLICKGAVEEVLAVCTRCVATKRRARWPLTPDLRRTSARASRGGLNAEGLRVVAVAVRELPPEQTDLRRG
jgi:Mg2+-importing ATPase